jgi:diaminohydroxyphosphoribosylaminopyrimidine deaminase/5-amino-6-(5-phosphoribosylamino)uracil reductase
MTLDGKIATASGESKWITGARAREEGMKLRQGADAILVGINTVLADNPQLTFRSPKPTARGGKARPLRRIILDSQARTPLTARVVSDEFASLTTIVVTEAAPARRIAALEKRVNVWIAPGRGSARAGGAKRVDLRWLLKKLGRESVTNLLVEGGGEVNAAFLFGGFAQRVAFFYAPKILGGRDARKAVAGLGARSLTEALSLRDMEWDRVGDDLMLTARVAPGGE